MATSASRFVVYQKICIISTVVSLFLPALELLIVVKTYKKKQFQRMFHCNVKCSYRLTNTYRRFPQTFREQGAVVYEELVQNHFTQVFTALLLTNSSQRKSAAGDAAVAEGTGLFCKSMRGLPALDCILDWISSDRSNRP